MSAPHRPLILGCDPGLSGALALYNFETKNLEAVHDMPLRKLPNGKNEVDGFALTQLIDRYHVRTALAVIEEVHSMPKQGVASTFTFGYAAGMVAGVISGFNVPILKTQPSVWKVLCGLTSNKAHSRTVAAKMFPEHAKSFQRAKDDGRAEASILAHFGFRFIKEFA